ncbi:MAG: arginine decarboxylase, pyruvoyl-dependent [Desulfobacterales bacterium]|nr:arginine decarboxylase, pyruvoyl-dependent [Desulfobacterales bacterium]MCP4163835.1 arginine decarboxylase, pyruvoyl-dependent [Deltaproteobacteria bacterium]
MYVPRYIFFTKGTGVSKEKLSSFENALCDARISQFNLVKVSSIYPPKSEIIDIDKGLKILQPGQVVHCVLSRAESQEPGRRMVASVGLALPVEKGNYGFLSEHCGFGQSEEEAGKYSERLAVSMLAHTAGEEICPDESYDCDEDLYEVNGKKVESSNFTMATTCDENGLWTTVISAAILVP